MPRSGGGKTKESVYITVEALGVQQASDQIKSIISPLQELQKLKNSKSDLAGNATEIAKNFSKAAAQMSEPTKALDLTAKTIAASGKVIWEVMSKSKNSLLLKYLDPKNLTSVVSTAKEFVDKVNKAADAIQDIAKRVSQTVNMLTAIATITGPIFTALKAYVLISKANQYGLLPHLKALRAYSIDYNRALQESLISTGKHVGLLGRLQLKATTLKDTFFEIAKSTKAEHGANPNQGWMDAYKAASAKRLADSQAVFDQKPLFEGPQVFSKLADKLGSSKLAVFFDDLQVAVNDASDAFGKQHPILMDISQGFSAAINAVKKYRKAIDGEDDKKGSLSVLLDGVTGSALGLSTAVGEDLVKSLQSSAPNIAKALDRVVQSQKETTLALESGQTTVLDLFKQNGKTIPTVINKISASAKDLAGKVLPGLGKVAAATADDLFVLGKSVAAHPALWTGLAAGIGASVAGLAWYIKSNEECLETFEKLNPEIETSTRKIAKLKDEYNALSMAVDSLWGRDWDNLVGNLKYGFYRTFDDIKTAYKEFMLVLFNGDTWKDRITAFGNWIKLYVAETAGFIWSTMTALAPNKLLKATGLSKVEDFLGKTIYDARAALQKGVQDVEGFNDQLERGKKYIEESKNKTKEAEQPVANIKNHVIAIKDEFADIVNMFADWQMIDGNWWIKSLDDKRKQLEQVHEDQLAALERIEGDPSIKASYRMQLEEDFQKQLQEIELENARETGNQQLVIARQYMDMERQAVDAARQQRLEADKAASDAKWQHELDKYNEQQRIEEEGRQNLQAYLSDVTGTVRGTLTDAFMSMFDMISGDVEDIRGHLFDMFNSMAQNLFRTSLDAIVNSIIKMSMESGASAAQTPVIGPALAIAAVSGTMALGMAIAKRNQKQKPKIQYATGGYISDGLVRGAGGSGDSVEALLQPGERVLSKAETEAYDKGRNSPANITVNVTINGQLSSQSQIRDTVRSVLIPEIRSAVKQGYSLGVA